MTVNVRCLAQRRPKVSAQVKTTSNHDQRGAKFFTPFSAALFLIFGLFEQTLGPGLPRAGPDNCPPPLVFRSLRGWDVYGETAGFQDQARSQSTFSKSGRKQENWSAWHPAGNPTRSCFPEAALVGREGSPRPLSAL